MTFLTKNDTLYAIEFGYECAALSYIIFEGKANVDAIRKRYEEAFINNRNSNGSLTFPNFGRILRQRFGYYFWLQSTIDINQHVIELNEKPETLTEFYEILSTILNRPMPRVRPLWKINIMQLPDRFDGLSGPHYAICEKYHHTLITGTSYVKIWHEKIFDESRNVNNTNESSLTSRLSTYLIAPRFFFESMLFNDDNSLSTFSRSGETILTAFSTPITLDRLKPIRQSTKATVNDIVLSCLAFALRCHFIRENVRIPCKIRQLVPHSVQVDKVSHALSFLPTAEMTAVDRLRLTKRHMDKLKGLNLFDFTYFFIHLFPNVLPGFLVNKILMGSHHTVDISNWFGFGERVTFFKSRIVDAGGFTTLTPSVGLYIAFASLNGKIVLSASADTAVVRNRNLLRKILEETVIGFVELEKEVGINN